MLVNDTVRKTWTTRNVNLCVSITLRAASPSLNANQQVQVVSGSIPDARTGRTAMVEIIVVQSLCGSKRTAWQPGADRAMPTVPPLKLSRSGSTNAS